MWANPILIAVRFFNILESIFNFCTFNFWALWTNHILNVSTSFHKSFSTSLHKITNMVMFFYKKKLRNICYLRTYAYTILVCGQCKGKVEVQRILFRLQYSHYLPQDYLLFAGGFHRKLDCKVTFRIKFYSLCTVEIDTCIKNL